MQTALVGDIGLLPRLSARPAALLRSGRRTGRTTMFVLDAAAHVRREISRLPDDGPATMKRQGYLAWLAANICALSGFEVRARGPLPQGPAIMVCNHVSWQDPILIADVVPAVPVAKSEVSGRPLVGDLARGLGVLLIERGSAHSCAQVLLRARTLLDRGASILTFPEGTTTHGDDILPFHRGMFGLARLMGLPVIPIALRYRSPDASWVGDANFLPHYLETVARPRTTVDLHFAPAMHCEPGETAQAFAERTRSVMRACLSTM
ncbi:MAG: 1-acyl-sn-glycerol-3-phosphate acyltransferase [Myxococcales bacterium]|nr:1-acyl-sn-glycerol-3-phosphate acyltransferase [Myxococcales bacterium]